MRVPANRLAGKSFDSPNVEQAFPFFRDGTNAAEIEACVEACFHGILSAVDEAGTKVHDNAQTRAWLRMLLARGFYSRQWIRDHCPSLTRAGATPFFNVEYDTLAQAVIAPCMGDADFPAGLQARWLAVLLLLPPPLLLPVPRRIVAVTAVVALAV